MKSAMRTVLARNITVMLAAQVVLWGSSFALLYFLPRFLGSDDFGRLFLALSIKSMLGLLIDFGGNYLIPKEVARSERTGAGILNSYIVLRIVLWVFSIGLIMLISNWMDYSEHIHILILVLAVGKLWEGGSTAIGAYFQGIERMEYPSYGSMAERLFVAVFAIAALLFGADSIGVAVIMTLGGLLNFVVLMIYARPFVQIRVEFDFKVFGLLGSGLSYFLFSLFSVIYYRIDAVMISALTTETVTGWYGGAFRFFDMVMVLPLLFKTAIFPVFSKLWDNEEGALETTIGESIRLMIILGLPTSILIYMLASPIIGFFMGLEEFGQAVVILKIFAVSIPIIYVDIILGSALLGAANKQHSWAVVGFMAILINVSANFLLIPYAQDLWGNGGIGAAVATFVTELFVMSIAFVLLPKRYLQTFKSSYLLKPVGVAVVMGLVLIALIWIGLHWMLCAILAGLVYVGGLFLAKTFSPAEVASMKRMATIGALKKMLFDNSSPS